MDLRKDLYANTVMSRDTNVFHGIADREVDLQQDAEANHFPLHLPAEEGQGASLAQHITAKKMK